MNQRLWGWAQEFVFNQPSGEADAIWEPQVQSKGFRNWIDQGWKPSLTIYYCVNLAELLNHSELLFLCKLKKKFPYK